MRIAFVGCGYVFDIYMRTRWAHPELVIQGVFDIDGRRQERVCEFYGLRGYDSIDSLLSDQAVDIVVNLTSIRSHHQVTKRALQAGKHVYSEKPHSTDIGLTRELFDLADERGRILSGAPCNLYSDALVTLWKAVNDGAVGNPRLIYAELDDNPAHLMQLEKVRSPSGAPFPVAEELQEGCTVEHIGYHLAWICALFGPARSVSGFSTCLIPKKTAFPLSPPDTPDLSVTCLDLGKGVAARLTCSWVAPRDHRIRIVGDEGEITLDNVFHDQSPVHLERFSRVSLAARKSYSVRMHRSLGRLFGVGGRRLPLLRRWKSHAVERDGKAGWSPKRRLVNWLRRREVYAQDKLLGIAEMARAIEEGRPQPMPADFLVHLNEITLMAQRAGPAGARLVPQSSFRPLPPLREIAGARVDYARSHRLSLIERGLARTVDSLHRG